MVISTKVDQRRGAGKVLVSDFPRDRMGEKIEVHVQHRS
jgi:hypothetical protein